MRASALIVFALLATPAQAQAQDKAVIAAPGPVSVNVNYTLNLPLDATTPAAEMDQERTFRKSMYSKAASECVDLLATIATACQITNIGMSTQINRYPGQAPTIYVNTSVTMQIALKG